MSIISEPGLYRVLSVSRSNRAKPFQRWLFHEVLPAIRKTGKYESLPEPEPRISSAQRHELNKAIRHALLGTHQECGEGGEQWVYNRLRIKLNLRNIDDMHPNQLPSALAKVKQLEQDLSGYFRHRSEQREFLCREIIGAGTPWTPTLAKNWKAQLKQLVPARPDWLAMRKKLLEENKLSQEEEE